MARYTTPSLRDVLKRWQGPHVLAIDTDHSTSDGGLHSASLDVSTDGGRATLLVTSVQAAAGENEVEVVGEMLDRLVHAPGDAAYLAAEVERLLRRIADLTGV